MQAITVAPGVPRSARVDDLPEPSPTEGQVLVRTLELGVCGTDREIIAGHVGFPPPHRDRMVLGHEVVGAVERGDDGLSPGDLVAATVRRRCSVCDGSCPQGSYDTCVTGAAPERGVHGLDGFGSELFVEWSENLVRVPAQLGRLGVLAEPMSVCERAVRHTYAVGRRQPWRPKRALVIGAGAIGVLSTALLRLRELEVYTVARSDAGTAKADIVEQLGARYVSTARTPIPELAAEVRPDIVIEATGKADVIHAAAAAVAPRGVACILGVDPEAGRVQLDGRLLGVDYVVGNRALIGSVNAAAEDWCSGMDDLVRVHESWPGVLERMIGLRVDPDAFGSAVAFTGVKATITFTGGET